MIKGSLGFLVDKRRMNVAITRAKHFLFIVGNSQTLSKDPIWEGLVNYCRNDIQNGYFKIDSRESYQGFKNFSAMV